VILFGSCIICALAIAIIKGKLKILGIVKERVSIGMEKQPKMRRGGIEGVQAWLKRLG